MRTKRPGTNPAPAAAGAAVYTRPTLAVYDLLVLGFSNSWAWRCPSEHLLDLYNAHVGRVHLDVGVGTGYFLDRCRFPDARPHLTLLDLNPASLMVAARRLKRYAPATLQANVLVPLPLREAQFDSIGINYVLHCLPGSLGDKARALAHLRPLLRPGGVLFGSTILGGGVPHNPLARALLGIYNWRGIFSNARDTADDLIVALSQSFHSCTIDIIGCVALFTARA